MDTELYQALTDLGRAKYLIHRFQLDHDGPLVVAGTLYRADYSDVVIMYADDVAYSYRTPSGQDVLNPTEVCWDCPGKTVRAIRAVLALPVPGERAAPTVSYAPQSGLCLPPERRGMPLRVKARGI